jgi:hypothetical protein
VPTESRLTRDKDLHFLPKYESITAILEDHDLAALGDAFVNLVYSLDLSRRTGKPAGRKLGSSTLASALRRADLRKLLPSGTDRHKQADAAESLIAYAWLVGEVSLEETLSIVETGKTTVDAFTLLLQEVFKSVSRRFTP